MSSVNRFLLSSLVLLSVLFCSTGFSQSSSDAPLNPEVSGDVEFWHFWGSPVRRTAVRRIVAICEQQLPNINVTEVFKPWGDIWTANIAAVAAGSGMPDIIVADRGQLPRDAGARVYQSIQSYVDRDGIDPTAFWDFTWDQTLFEGESYGIPFETDIRVTYYNQTLLEEAGLDPENLPETWEEWWDVADTLDVKNEDGTFERITFDVLGGNGAPNIWFLLNNANLVRDGKVTVNTPEAVETVTWLKRWIDRYGGFEAYNRFTSRYSAPPNDIFMAGGAIAKIDVAGYNSILNFYRPRVETADGEAVDMQWGAALPPYDADAEPASASGGFALSIPVGAENPEAAWEFIKCASSIPSQVSWARDTAAIPTTVAAAEDPQLMADPLWPFFIDAMEVAEIYPFIEAYPSWEQELLNRFEAVWRGDMTPKEMLDEAQAAIDAEIAKTASTQ